MVWGHGPCWQLVPDARAPGWLREAEKSLGWQVSRDGMPTAV